MKLLLRRTEKISARVPEAAATRRDRRADIWHRACRTPCAACRGPRLDCPMTFLTDDRPLTFVTTAALTAYDVVSVAMWALLLCLAARLSRGSLSRDLFGV